MIRTWIISIIVFLGWLAIAGYMDKQREEMTAREQAQVVHP